jgi:hypothetical protein
MTSSTFYAQQPQHTVDDGEEATSHSIFANEDVEEMNSDEDVFGDDDDSSLRSPSDIAVGAAGTSLVDRIENIVQKES